MLYATHASAIASDAIVLIMTWIKTFHIWRQGRQLNMLLPITTSLLRDGKLSYTFMGVTQSIEECNSCQQEHGSSCTRMAHLLMLEPAHQSILIFKSAILVINIFHVATARTVCFRIPQYLPCIADKLPAVNLVSRYTNVSTSA